MSRSTIRFLFLNLGHFLDHYVLLIFATAAALSLTKVWGTSYASLIPYATPGFIAFGLCALPAGWLADKWSREGMLAIFYFGIGLSLLLAGMARNPVEMAFCLTLIGVFAAIYHPVGLAMVIEGRAKTGIPLAINGVFGNMGVACAALFTGFFIDTLGWRSAFVIPGFFCLLSGVLYLMFVRNSRSVGGAKLAQDLAEQEPERQPLSPGTMRRVFGVIFFTTAVGGWIFQSTTFALPKVFDERLGNIAESATMIGAYGFVVFSVAAFGQVIVGYLLDRKSLRAVFKAVALLQVIFFLIMVQLEGIAALITAIAFMLVVFGQVPINDVLVGRMVRSEWRSRAFAIRYIVSFSVMASAVPMIAWIHGRWGFDALFLALAAAASLVFVAVMLLPAEARH